MNWVRVNSSTREAYSFDQTTSVEKYRDEWVAFVDGLMLFYPTKDKAIARCEEVLSKDSKL
jgi:hypothetical protein